MFDKIYIYVCLYCLLSVHRLVYRVQDSVSRPSSQMSHAASSGYGSARSTSRTVAEVVNTDDGNQVISQSGQVGRMSRNTFANSLRKPKVADSGGMVFRSLRAARNAEPPTKTPSEPTAPAPHLTVPGVIGDPTSDIACLPLMENAGALALIPLQTSSPTGQQQEEHELQLSIPVPAPRFHTLKRHAYQNIPLPIKKAPGGTDQQLTEPQQFVEVYNDTIYASILLKIGLVSSSSSTSTSSSSFF